MRIEEVGIRIDVISHIYMKDGVLKIIRALLGVAIACMMIV